MTTTFPSTTFVDLGPAVDGLKTVDAVVGHVGPKAVVPPTIDAVLAVLAALGS